MKNVQEPTEEAKQRAKNYMSLKGALEPKQTVIDFIISQLKEQIRKSAHNELGTTLRTGEYRIGLTKAIHFCEEAREMFEQQIIDACNQIDVIGPDHQQPGEQYYNQTYKQQKTMTPKEKAAELVNKFVQYTPAEEGIEYPFAKQCAVIAVDEILLLCPFETYRETLSPYDGVELSTKYWQEVKQEIQNL